MLETLEEVAQDIQLQLLIKNIKNSNNVLSPELSNYLFKKYCKRKKLQYCQPAMCPFKTTDNCACTDMRAYIAKVYDIKIL
jgi:hypothetical protein